MSATMDYEKGDDKSGDQKVSTLPSHPTAGDRPHAGDDEFEIFKNRVGENEVNFRNMHWLQASAIFLKVQFSLGVLSIPSAFAILGAVPGSLVIIASGAMNICWRFFSADLETITLAVTASQANIVGGPIARELAGLWFLVGYILCVGAGYLATSVAFNTFSEHGACTVYYVLAAFLICTVFSAFPRFSEMSWISWSGAISIIVSVFVMVVAVAVRDRPYAAPAGVTDFGYRVVNHPNFNNGIVATSIIFVSTSGHSAFIPVISEMKRPQDYDKAVYLCYAIVNACYLSFSLVVFKYAGVYVASPSLGSAGVSMQKICYGLSLIGLFASAIIYQHVAGKYLFVRILRNSRHLQTKTFVHWAVWLGSIFFVGIISFILAESIPIFNYLIALLGSFCFAPLAILMPCTFYLYMYAGDFRQGRKLPMAALHVLLFCCGAVIFIGGTYAVCIQIRDAYRDGTVGSAFNCADNSGLAAA